MSQLLENRQLEAQSHQASPQEVPISKYIFLNSYLIVVRQYCCFVPVCTCKMGVHMAISQQSNTIVCYNFDQNFEEKKMF